MIIGDCMLCFLKSNRARPSILVVQNSAGEEIRWRGLGGKMSPWMELDRIRHNVSEIIRGGEGRRNGAGARLEGD